MNPTSTDEPPSPGSVDVVAAEGDAADDSPSGERADGGRGERHIPIEISLATDGDERPPVEEETRVDVAVDGQMYPTARLADGRYVAWWFEADAPALEDPATTEWVAAPTRFLAAGTLHELWEDPTAFDALADDASEYSG